jgi:predicted transcriptional regulator
VLKLRSVSKSVFTQSNDEFRALLKELRVRRGLTQADVTKVLRLPQSYVSKVETGERRMDFVETVAFTPPPVESWLARARGAAALGETTAKTMALTRGEE